MSYKLTKNDLTKTTLGAIDRARVQELIDKGECTVGDLISGTYYVPSSIVHWARNCLPITEDEVDQYEEAFNISESEYVTDSEDIDNCYLVSNSADVSQSSYVFDSKNVHNSEAIYQSDDVDTASDVARSFMVYESHKIENSKNVNNSTRIMHSNFVLDSSSVLHSKAINNCTSILGSDRMENCHFCVNCVGLTNSFFCKDVTVEDSSQGEFLLFNKPISPKLYDMVTRQFHNFLFNDNVMIEFCEEWVDLENIPTVAPAHQIISPKKIMNDIPKKFWDWVVTLPGYTEDFIISFYFTFAVV